MQLEICPIASDIEGPNYGSNNRYEEEEKKKSTRVTYSKVKQRGKLKMTLKFIDRETESVVRISSEIQNYSSGIA